MALLEEKEGLMSLLNNPPDLPSDSGLASRLIFLNHGGRRTRYLDLSFQ